MKYSYRLRVVEEDSDCLTLSNKCLISPEDADLLKYIYYPISQRGYVVLRESLNWTSKELLHRVVMKRALQITLPKHLVVDHINNNKLDNRRENLQLLTVRNNSTKDRKESSTFYRVNYHKRDDVWRVVFNHEGRFGHYGQYKNEEDAAYWADVWAVKLLPEGTLLNFPARLDEYKVKASELKYQG